MLSLLDCRTNVPDVGQLVLDAVVEVVEVVAVVAVVDVVVEVVEDVSDVLDVVKVELVVVTVVIVRSMGETIEVVVELLYGEPWLVILVLVERVK